MLIRDNNRKAYGDTSDLELCRLTRWGDEDAFSELFRRHYNALYQYGMSFYSSKAFVKDCIQTLFLRLWRKKEYYLRDIQSPRAYLLVSLRRIMLRDKKKRSARKERNREYASDFSKISHAVEQSIIDREITEEHKVLLETALNSLTKRQKEAFVLRLHQGLDNEEIAYVMEITKGRVEDLIYHATKSIKKEISERA
ncbi:RNA polymerase sigma-70 factor, ECF subfamily [Fodinibius roseus]|uniref:RNA polymerase sigma-70 factor, ECF subfamily n=1 Tax=Fodinibius roseus TaxID=1194090 RepID=A0A1M5DT30_9BACT|nr:sigma-70 family RNA polymerase sigma factor [Fodinibius roseus]SHF70011.1 RNA polymerase sigma-70 factor, ECF subfamily [Fodinibius roseus]